MKPQFNPHEQVVEQTRKPERPIFPADECREQTLETLFSAPSALLFGETGSGKTTRVPVHIMDQFPHKKIAVTSPRATAAVEIASYVAEGVGDRLGGRVGVMTRDNTRVSRDTQLTYLTDGTLLAMFQDDPLMEKYDVVMVDEAHERGLNCDIALGLLKLAQEERTRQGLPPLQIIVSSATMEEETFVNYFNQAPIARVPGRMFPVDVEYRDIKKWMESEVLLGRQWSEQVYPHFLADLALEELKNNDEDGDILVFLPGEQEISLCRGRLERGIEMKGYEVDVRPLFGRLNTEDKKLAIKKGPRRKIILATNIAETSLTIDGLALVIDSGLERRMKYNPATQMSSLVTENAAYSSLKQREGRAGRISKGRCIRMMTEEEFVYIQENHNAREPDIRISDISKVALDMKAIGIGDVAHFPYVTEPDPLLIVRALLNLVRFGALDDKGVITEKGEVMARFPLTPEMSCAMLEAKELGVLSTAVSLSAALSVSGNLMFKARDTDPQGYDKERLREALFVKNSDYLTLLNIVQHYEDELTQGRNAHKWAEDRLLNVQSLKEILKVKKDLQKQLALQGIDIEECSQHVQDQNMHELVTRFLLASKSDKIYTCNISLKKSSLRATSDHLPQEPATLFPGSSSFGNMSTEFAIGENVHEGRGERVYVKTVHAVTLDEIRKYAPRCVSDTEEVRPAMYGGYGARYQVTKVNDTEVSRVFIGYAEAADDDRQVTPWYDSPRYERPFTTYDVGLVRMENGQTISEHNSHVSSMVNNCAARDGRVAPVDPYFAENKIRQLLADKVITKDTPTEEIVKLCALVATDYVSEEMQEEIRIKSPNKIILGEVEIPVTYKIHRDYVRGGGSIVERVASVELNFSTVTSLLRSVDTNLTFDFPLVDKVTYKYSYNKGRDWGGYRTDFEAGSLNGIIQFYKTNRDQSAERDQFKRSEGLLTESEIKAIHEGSPEYGWNFDSITLANKEGKARARETLLEIGSYIAAIKDCIDRAEDSSKKNKLLTQCASVRKTLKEIGTELDAYVAPLPGSRIKSNIQGDLNKMGSSVMEILQSPDMVSALQTGSKKYVFTIASNIALLRQAAHDGGVDLDDDMQKKIISKSVALVISQKPEVLTEDKANDMIIELLE